MLLAGMAGIFFCISGAVNSYVNFDRLKEGKLTTRELMAKSTVTGLMLIIISVVFRYFLLRTTDNVVSFIPGTDTIQYWNETGVLPYLILYGVYPAKFNIWILFGMGTLSMIGYTIISVSVVMVLYQKYKSLENQEDLRRLFLFLGIIIFLASGLTYRFIYGPVLKAVNGGNFLVAIFLSPLFIGSKPVFPHLAYGFFGAYFGISFAKKDAEPNKVLRNMFWFWVFLLSSGVGILAVCIPKGLFETWYFVWGEKLFQLGFYFFLFWLGMKYVDYSDNEVRGKRMKWLNPLVVIGRVTLTIYILEGTLAVIMQKLLAPVWPSWNASIGNAALFGVINVVVWAIIIILWKRVDFAGSLEWTSAWLIKNISGQRSSKLDTVITD
jgi:hypothetical protein